MERVVGRCRSARPGSVTSGRSVLLPQVATDVGGTAELVHPSDASRVLAQPNPKSLAGLLRPILQEARTHTIDSLQRIGVATLVAR